jgi:hypothetical protein
MQDSIRLSTVINSSLGDALLEMANGDTQAAAHRVAFVKWITFYYRDLNVMYDPTALYYEYLEWKS